MSSLDSFPGTLCSGKSSEVQIASDICWNRLKTVALAIRSTREKLEYHQLQLNEGGDLHYLVEAHLLANEIQNFEIVISREHKAVEHLKRMCTKKRLILRKTDEELAEKECQSDLKTKLLGLDDHCAKAAYVLKTRRKYVEVFTQLARARRRMLLNEISIIFRIMVQVARDAHEKQICPCSTIDSICNVHLPPVTELIGHQDIEIAAALGYVAHFLNCVSKLLDYRFRYPLQPGASSSCICSPKDKKSLPLYGSKWRAGREKFDQAVTLLRKNISQLREDSGFSSFHSERVLLSIHEWLEGVLHSGMPVIYRHRPTSNLSSPAVLVAYQQKPVNEELLRSISQLEMQLDGHCNTETSSLSEKSCSGGGNAHSKKSLPRSGSIMHPDAMPDKSDEVSHGYETTKKPNTDCSSDEDEVLLEPRFKYERVEGSDAKQMIASQVITAVVAHAKLITVGTQMGYIWVMDHLGHVDHQNVPVIRPHRSAVTRLAIDELGNYVMSCANDCRVAISGIGTSTLNYVLNLAVMPRSIAISPFFSRSTSVPMFVVGERNLIFYEKKFFKYKEVTIFRGGEEDGFITQCSWKHSFIAFTSDRGTRIFDRLTCRLISFIPKSHDVDRIRSSRFPPTHCWLGDSQLAIAWADTINIVMVVSSEEARIKQVEIHFTWHLDMFCSGISYMLDSSGTWNGIVVFGLKPVYDNEDTDGFCDTASLVSLESAMSGSGPTPLIQLCLLAPETYSTYRLLSEDRLSLSVKPCSQPYQFALAGLPSCDSYFLIGPSDLIMAAPYCAADTVKWRAENGLLEEAWELAREKNTELEDSKWDSRTVGRAMIEHLLRSGKPRQAAAKIAEVCGESSTEWEWAVGAFERARVCTLIAQLLPTSHPQLEPECYEVVLQAALYNDVDLFKRLVQQWSPDLYRTGSITGMALRRIQELVTNQSESNPLPQKDEILLYHALAHLYVYERKFDSAIKIYMSLRDQQIFAVIDKYQLFEHVKDQISELMLINTDRALRLLLDNEDSVPASLVMTKIARQPKLQMAYLTKLLNKNEAAEFADLAVRLYAEHDRKKLMPFLRKNENYHISRALEVCRQKNFIEEMILLLGKSGNHIDALDLMVKKYNQLDKAIEYCKEHDDTDLWERLIDEVIKTPDHVAHLLNHAGSSVDPLRVIQMIPPNMAVPGLRDALVKVLRDYAARVELQRGCHEATRSDVRILLSTYLRMQALSVAVSPRKHCSICGYLSFMSLDKRGSELRVFSCGHVAHSTCCLEEERKVLLEPGACAACSEATRDECVS